MSDEWQPIETLPRDGRYVLAYRPLAMETGDEALAVVKTTKSPTTSPQGVQHWTSRWCHPTHWMDIPEPPRSVTVGLPEAKKTL
jgi:hypothetical protein